jgi:hypothetical protein
MWSSPLKFGSGVRYSGFQLYKLTIESPSGVPSEGSSTSDTFQASFTVGVGKTQEGNDKLLTHFEPEREDALWYHLSKSTSCHVVAFPKPTREQQSEVDKAIINKFFERSQMLKKNKDPTVMCCDLKNVKKTNTLGLVETSNPRYIKQ